MVRNIEETQMDMYDKLELLTSHFSGGNGSALETSAFDARIQNIEKQLINLSSTVTTISDTLLQLAGHQSGSKNLMDQVAQLNQIAHNKLTFLEEHSKQSFERAERLHTAFNEKESSTLWWYVALICLQLIVVIWLALNWKKGDGRNINDKKFI
jgi:hypothetical protein